MSIVFANRSKILECYDNKTATLENLYDAFADVRLRQKSMSDHTVALLIIDHQIYAAFEAWQCDESGLNDEERYTYHVKKNNELSNRFANIFKLPELKGVR